MPSIKIFALIQKHTGITFCVALLLGILLPVNRPGITSLLFPLMGFLLFLSFLGVDVSHVKAELRRPLRLAGQVFLFFIALPVGLYFVLRLAGLPGFALSVLLLTLMPGGLGSPVFASIAGARVATSAVLSVVTHVLVPLTVPLLFWALSDVSVSIDVPGMARNLLLLIGIPVALAAIARTAAPAAVARAKPHRKLWSIFALCGVAYIVIVPYADVFRTDPISVVPTLAGTYLVFAALCVSTFLLSPRRKPDERAALIISRVYMNNALAIVLAVKFFPEHVAFTMILSEIPWFTTFGLYLWFQKRYLDLKPA